VTVSRGRRVITLRVLKSAKFKCGGQFSRSWNSKSRAPAPPLGMPRKPGNYAYVIGRTVKYFGATDDLRARMFQYQRSTVRDSGVYRELRDAVAQGKHVQVWYAAPGMSRWHGLPLIHAFGIEHGLKRDFRKPAWNSSWGLDVKARTRP
jgi:hypothetical protein